MNIDHSLRYVYGWNRYTMEYMGIWPRERMWNEKSSYKVLIPITIICFVCIPQSTNLFFIWDNFDQVVENLSMANMSITIALLKVIAFWYHGKTLKSLLRHMVEDWHSSNSKKDQETMDEVGRLTRLISTRSTLMCVVLVVVYVIMRYFHIRHCPRSLLFRAYYPFDTGTSPIYEMVVLGQLLGGTCSASLYTAVDTFVAMLVFHVCGQLSNLRRELIDLKAQSREELRLKVRRIAKKHEYLGRFANATENCFSVMLLVQMLGCTCQLCFQSFQVLMSFSEERSEIIIAQLVFLSIYLSYVILHLYLYCYVGEKLLVQSTEIAYAAYDSEWYNLSVQEAKLLMIIMCRAKSPFRLTAGRFCSFNIKLFSEILRRSLGYMSVLYAVRD